MTCRTGKIEYASPQAAHAVIASMGKRHEASKRHAMGWAKGRVAAYKCAMCGCWHVGHTPAAKGVRA
jgi:hypothetical protein